MGTVGEIAVLIKFSPKREKMLGVVNENIVFSSDKDEWYMHFSYFKGKDFIIFIIFHKCHSRKFIPKVSRFFFA